MTTVAGQCVRIPETWQLHIVVLDGAVVTGAGPQVAMTDMAIRARQIRTFRRHMNVHMRTRCNQSAGQIAVFHIVAATPVEVAIAAIRSVRSTHVARYSCQVRGHMSERSVCLLDNQNVRIRLGSTCLCHRHVKRVTGFVIPFRVLACRIVTRQAVHSRLFAEVESLRILPTIACVARSTARLIGCHIPAEGIDDMLLAQGLSGNGMIVLPGPVNRLLHLTGSLRVAGQTSASDIRRGVEWALQGFEP